METFENIVLGFFITLILLNFSWIFFSNSNDKINEDLYK